MTPANREEQVRVVDGQKVAFVTHDVYFASLYTPSMYSTAKAAGANIAFLLAPGKAAADVTDDEIRALLKIAYGANDGR